MEDRNFGINQGSPGHGGTSKPGGKPPGKDGEGDRGDRQPDKPAARPTPSGVPNEGRGVEGESGNEKPRQSGDKQGSRDGQGGMQTPGQGGDKHDGREGAPGGRGQTGRQGKGSYEYKGGRQGQGGVPNPDDEDDGESAGSFRGTAVEESDAGDDEGEPGLGVEQKREQNPDQRRAQSSDDKTRNPA